jgi:hypothetical protein
MNQVAIAGLALTIFGCAATEPLPQFPETEAAVAAAETVGANENPKAALHLKLAKDQLHAAKLLVEDGDEDKARLTLDRARQDAELALALTQEQKAREEAQLAIRRVDELENKK